MTYHKTFFYQANDFDRVPLLSLLEIKELVGMKIPSSRVVQENLDPNGSALSRKKLHLLIHGSNWGCQVICTQLEHLGHDAADIQSTLQASRACNMKMVCLEISPTLDLAGDDGIPFMRTMVAYIRLLSAARGRVIREGQERARSKGQSVGRRIEISENTTNVIRSYLQSGLSPAKAGKKAGVDRWTVYRVREREARRPPAASE